MNTLPSHHTLHVAQCRTRASSLHAWLLAGALLWSVGVRAADAGNCLSFDGANDYVSIADANSLDLTANYTLECWFKADSFGATGTLRGLIDKYQSANSKGYLLRLTGSDLDFDLKTTSGLNLQAGQWYHVAAVNSGGTRHLYVNGVEKTLSGTGYTVVANTDPVRLGSDYDARYFAGQMDEVRIWNVARSLAEIRDAMHKQLAGSESGLVAYYQFNQNSGTTLPDLTANANNGTLVNMADDDWVASTLPCADAIAGRSNIRGVWAAHTTSLASSRFTVANATVTAPAFAVIGHDNGADAWQTADVPSGIVQRLTRVWQTELSGSATADIRIDTTGLSDIGDGSGLRLLVDADGTFVGGTTVLPGTFSNPTFTVSGQTLSSGAYYTLALCQHPFTELDPGFRAGGWYAKAVWGDYDNDGDLDLLLLGYQGYGSPQAAAKIYRNNGDGSFTDIDAGLPNVEYAAAWGDCDRDGDLDLAISGYVYETGAKVTEIYRNDGGVFTPLHAGLTPVDYSALAWGDYDNDGDLDLVVAGTDATVAARTTLYRNDAGVFVDVGAGLLNVDGAALAWGDYDNDGDLDLVVSGYDSTGTPRTQLYRNDGGVFVPVAAGLVGVANCGAAVWGDYDHDGDLDLLLSGEGAGDVAETRLYHNNGDGTFRENTAAGLPAVAGAAAWGDYDNDGQLDLVLSGELNSGHDLTDVYWNNGDGTFTALGLSLKQLEGGTVAWGDYDNDGDLDLLVAGYSEADDTEYTRLYRNNTSVWNTPPGAPSGLSVVRVGNNGAFVSWNPAADSEAGALSYNLRVGTTSGDDDVVVAMADLTGGCRRVAALGNSQMGRHWLVDHLDLNTTYYWSVQAVDTAWAGGAWAGEGSFRLADFATVTTAPATKLAHTSAQGSGSAAGTGITQKGLVWDANPWPTLAGCLGSTQHGAGADSFSDTLSGLTAGVTYYVRAYAVNGAGTSYGDQRTFVLSAAAFTELDPGFQAGGWYAKAVWGDYDNDGDLDLLLLGYDDHATPRAFARIYRNNGDGSFTDINAGLPNVEYAAAWGDYDRDGDLDLAISGYVYETGANVTEIYRNDGGVFTALGAGLTPVQYSALAWGDYDNDGDLDLVVAGYDSTLTDRTQLYRNDAGVFVDAGAGLLNVEGPALAWGDYDNDGDLDLVVSGYDSTGTERTQLYRNDGGALVPVAAGLVGVANCGAAVWGDYDHDGDLDLLLSGEGAGDVAVTRLYRNDGDGTFTENTAAGLPAVAGAAAWGDYDNDGELDLVLSGELDSGDSFTDVYRNKGDGTFTALGLGLKQLEGGTVAWGDYDNDGDLDFLVAGYSEADDTEYTRLYRNNTSVWNTPPAAPTGLAANVSGRVATLSWNAAGDSQTPASGLTYNLRVGTSPGAANVFSGMANPGTGQRRLPALGNANENLGWTIGGLTPGQTYYWSVQAIDTALAGGAWAAEGSFHAPGEFHWTGDASNGKWDLTSANWSGVGLRWVNGPGSEAIFDDATSPATDFDADITANTLRFMVNGFDVKGNAHTLTLAGTDSAVEVADSVSATLGASLAGTVGLTKTGAGTLTLTAPHTDSGDTTVAGGTLALVQASHNPLPGSPNLIVQSGAVLDVTGLADGRLDLADGQTLKGDGTVVGTLGVPDGATLAPGTSPGILNSGNVVFSSGATFAVEIEGPTVGDKYDQLNVTGTVQLGDATLSLAGSYMPHPGDTFVIIKNDDTEPVIGAFAGLPEGATLIFKTVSLTISYTGGDGHNDVTLSAPPPTAARLAYFRALTSGDGQVALSWGTLVEVQTLGFHLDRAVADGHWERITAQLIPALGFDQRPPTYGLVDASAPAGQTARYRLIEVDIRGRESVVAEAMAKPAIGMAIERTTSGLRLSAHGTPNGSAVVESATDVTGPWSTVSRLPLDEAGAATFSLEVDGTEPTRFYRIFPQ